MYLSKHIVDIVCISRAQLRLAFDSQSMTSRLTFTSKNSQAQLKASSRPLIPPSKLLYSRDSNPRNSNNGHRDANFSRQLCGRLRKLKSVGVANGAGVLS
jgi:hypothetical protein